MRNGACGGPCHNDGTQPVWQTSRVAIGHAAGLAQPSRMKYDAIVVGAGHNGLVAAAYLARAGLATARARAQRGYRRRRGERASLARLDGVCRLIRREPLASRDRARLDLESHGYHAYLKNPQFVHGHALTAARSCFHAIANRRHREVGAFSDRTSSGLASLDELLCRHAREIYDAFLADEPRFDRLSPEAQAMFRGSAAEFAERYVETPMLAAAIANDGIVGTFVGPRDPGTGYVLAHHYAGRAMGIQGAWGYVRGGMGSISTAIASAARQHGAQIRTNAEVASVLEQNGRAAGVVLADGSELEADAVLSGADPLTTFGRLIPQGVLEPAFRKRVQDWRCEGPSLKLNLALGELPNFTCRPRLAD